jgi:hypothetical protein
MNQNKCPIPIIALAFLYAATGIIGFIKNLHAFGGSDFWLRYTNNLAGTNYRAGHYNRYDDLERVGGAMAEMTDHLRILARYN